MSCLLCWTGELFVWGQHTSQLTPVIALVPQCQKAFVQVGMGGDGMLITTWTRIWTAAYVLMQDTEIRDVAIMWTSGKQGIPPVAYMMDTLRIWSIARCLASLPASLTTQNSVRLKDKQQINFFFVFNLISYLHRFIADSWYFLNDFIADISYWEFS